LYSAALFGSRDEKLDVSEREEVEVRRGESVAGADPCRNGREPSPPE